MAKVLDSFPARDSHLSNNNKVSNKVSDAGPGGRKMGESLARVESKVSNILIIPGYRHF